MNKTQEEHLCRDIRRIAQGIERIAKALESLGGEKERIVYCEQLPSAQPERKDAIEKAVAVEAISDELMSRFDISATYAYDVAESAVNRIEEMAKEMGKR